MRRLLDEGHQVVGLDTQKGLFFDELTRRARITLGSVTDRATVERLMKGVDVVHHVAAAFRQLDVGRDVTTTSTSTARASWRTRRTAPASANLLQHVRRARNVENPPATEDVPIAPADTTSARSTRASASSRSTPRAGFRLILRPAGIYGPGDPERFYMIFRRVARGWFPMFGDGKTLYHSVYIDNLIDAFMLAMESPRGDGRPYLIADEKHCTIEELVRLVADAIGVQVRFRHFPLMPLLVAGHVIEKACRPFGIAPPIFRAA